MYVRTTYVRPSVRPVRILPYVRTQYARTLRRYVIRRLELDRRLDEAVKELVCISKSADEAVARISKSADEARAQLRNVDPYVRTYVTDTYAYRSIRMSVCTYMTSVRPVNTYHNVCTYVTVRTYLRTVGCM